MMVTLQQVCNGISKYIDREIAAKTSGLTKFMAYFIIPSVPNKVNELMNKYQAVLTPYIDDNGNVDLDQLYTACKQAMQRTIQVEWNGIIFKENDIDMLYQFIRE